jgi:hypothetical protein
VRVFRYRCHALDSHLALGREHTDQRGDGAFRHAESPAEFGGRGVAVPAQTLVDLPLDLLPPSVHAMPPSTFRLAPNFDHADTVCLTRGFSTRSRMIGVRTAGGPEIVSALL